MLCGFRASTGQPSTYVEPLRWFRRSRCAITIGALVFVSRVGCFTLIRRGTSSCGTTIVVLSSKKHLIPEGTSLCATTAHHSPFNRVSIVSFADVVILCMFVVTTHVSMLYGFRASTGQPSTYVEPLRWFRRSRCAITISDLVQPIKKLATLPAPVLSHYF